MFSELRSAIGAVSGVATHQLVREILQPVSTAAGRGLFSAFGLAALPNHAHIVKEPPCRN